ncbi:cell wall-binding repeat-containing protein [Peptostreptococcus sp. D1]|uniref:cell wall-binding repeat-containing protein n=1 Tax=Peptostreptococcus sp. D1 TaxID=72304 RepID=UPI0008E1D5C9|nr:cell wall-binding repeat-containing protein [Peptostreptococcus sp. D1]SFE17217.1 Putative cell wall binding repeat 2 [Peptostreptococcus sp. D1]
MEVISESDEKPVQNRYNLKVREVDKNGNPIQFVHFIEDLTAEELNDKSMEILKSMDKEYTILSQGFSDSGKEHIINVLLKASQVKPISDASSKAYTASNYVVRVSGVDRIETAIEVSKRYYNKSDKVIIVESNNFPDAMTSSVIAKLLKAPILLVNRDKLDTKVASEIQKLGVNHCRRKVFCIRKYSKAVI